MNNRIFSGIQPTSKLTIGNYLGAIKNWVKLQSSTESLFCIVDMHAITLPQIPKELYDNTIGTAAAYIACGIDPDKSIIFVQSHVHYHTELAWILGCYTPMGWLNRMTQFKDKAGKHKETAGLGLYAYPVLQAADILVYKATHVPVGEDQKQHLELVRDLAGTFNHTYNIDFFPLPEPQITGPAPRVMSLRDGTVKMSKSDPSDFSRIHLIDDAETITLKIRKAKTDPAPLPATLKELETRPEAKNLLVIYAAFADQSLEQTCHEFAGKQFSELKPKLADLLIASLEPIQRRMHELLKEKSYLSKIMVQGCEAACKLAAPTVAEVKEIVGFWDGKHPK
jgi:tryptophanyl-tRNA synthetase